MSPSAKPRAGNEGAAAPTESVRARILNTARELFYKEGVRAVGVDLSFTPVLDLDYIEDSGADADANHADRDFKTAAQV